MTYALRIHLAHQGDGCDAFARLLQALSHRDHDLRVGRHEALVVPVGELEGWQADFALAPSMRAAASLDGLAVSMGFDFVPLPTMVAMIPANREDVAVAVARRLAAAVEVDFGVLQKTPQTAPAQLTTDEDRLAYLALASVNLGGERFASVGPLAPGVVTLVSPRVAALSRSGLDLDDLQGLTPSSVGALQASGVGATFSSAPNGRRLVFVKGPSWVPPPRTQPPAARTPAAQALAEKLALSAKQPGLVDFEAPEIPAATSLLFLTAPDAKAEMLALQGSALRWSLLDRATLSESAFIECDLLGSSLAASRLLETRLEGCRASDASFMDAVIAGGLVRSCDLRRTRFDRAALSHTQFRDCDLRGAALDGATFDRVTFERCRIDAATVPELQSRGARVQ